MLMNLSSTVEDPSSLLSSSPSKTQTSTDTKAKTVKTISTFKQSALSDSMASFASTAASTMASSSIISGEASSSSIPLDDAGTTLQTNQESATNTVLPVGEDTVAAEENVVAEEGQMIDEGKEMSLTLETKVGVEKEGSKKSVTFSTVHMHVYAIRLGWPPAIPIIGPPITIDREKEFSKLIKVDDFEDMRGPPRKAQKLKIPSSIRVKWLKDEGYTMHQISFMAQLAENPNGYQETTTSGRVSEGGARRRKRPPPKKKPKTTGAAAGNAGGGGGCCSKNVESQVVAPTA